MKERLVRLTLRMLKKMQLLQALNFSVSSDRGKIRIPLVRGIGYDHFFESEKWLDELLSKWLAKYCSTKYFIDVGANIGQTLIKVKRVAPATRYIGFEPNPNCLSYLYELLRINNFGVATIYPVAIAEIIGTTDLQLYTGSPTDSTASLVQGFRSSSIASMKVPVLNLQSLRFADDVAAGIIKIDVEGGELEVIKGLKEIIVRDRPLLICEVLPSYSEKNVMRANRQKELVSLLQSMMYSIALIHEDGSLEPMDQLPSHDDISRVNYLFFPRETDIGID